MKKASQTLKNYSTESDTGQPARRWGTRSKIAIAALSLGLAFLASPTARADSDAWDGSTDATWATNTNWLNDPAAVPGAGETATFNAASTFTVIDLGSGGQTIGSILFDTGAAAYTIGSGAVGEQTLTLDTTGNAITMNSSVANNQLFNANLALTVTRTAATPSTYYALTNDSLTNTLTVAGGISASTAGVKVLNVTGSGNTAISGQINSGAGNMSLFKTGSGTLTLSGGGTFSGNGITDGANFASSAVFREGTTVLSGGSYSNSNGELIVGGVATHGGAGTNATLQLDNGASLSGITWLSVGRGNGNGTATSDLTLNNAATITATNMSVGFNAGNAANIPKGTVTLNGTSILTITNTVNFAESAGTEFTLNINGTSQFRQTANANETRVGISDGAIGTINVNGGSATFERDLTIGDAGTAIGRLNLTSGTVNVASTAERWLKVGDGGTSTGEITIDGGTLNLNAGTDLRFTPSGGGGTNVVTLNGGSIVGTPAANGGPSVVDLNRGGGATANNTFNLNGGTLAIAAIETVDNGEVAVFNFNGGTLKPIIANTNFIDLGGANQRANVRNGGAIIDSNGFNVTVLQALLHSNIGGDAATDGGLTKTGVGILTLTGANTYTGTTTVSNGTLALGGTGAINSSSGITVNGSGARFRHVGTVASTPAISLTQGTLDGTGTVGAVTVNGTGGVVSNGTGAVGNTSALTLGSLTFSSAGSFSLNKANDTSTVALTITGDLTTIPGITLNIPTAPIWANGSTYNLIGYGGAFNGSNSDFTVGTLAGLGARQSATIGNTGASNGFITLFVDGDTPYWTGAENNSWTTATGTGTKNWELATAGTATDFLTNDHVLFDDNATGSTSVNISDANVGVASVTFNNSTKDYTISSTGGFGIVDGSAAASLVKNGSGTVTLATNNSYTGTTSVNAGTLNLMGTLNGSSVSTSGTAVLNQSATGAIAGTGVTLTQGSTGTSVLAGTNTHTGATAINAGTLEFRGAAAMSSSSALSLGNGATLSLRADGNTTFTAASLGGLTGAGTTRTIQVNSLNSPAGDNSTLSISGPVSGGTGTPGSPSTLNVTSTTDDTLRFANTFTLNGTGGGAWAGDRFAINLTNANMELNGLAQIGLNGGISVDSSTGNSLTINGDVSNVGSRTIFAQVNSGTLTLNNTHSGANSGANWGFFVTLNGGTLNVNNNDAIESNSGIVGNRAGLAINGGTLNNTSGAAKTLTANPTVLLNGDFAFSTGSGTSANDLDLGTGAASLGPNAGTTRTITTNGSATLTIGGAIANGTTANSITKAGTGTLILAGASTYTGATTINAGTLAIGAFGSIANSSEVKLGGGTFDVSATGAPGLTLGAGQKLSGSGTVTGNMTVDGNLAIGNSPGTITFNDNLTLGSTSVSDFEFTDSSFGIGTFDLAQGTGDTVTFGGTLNLFFSGGAYANGSSVTIFDGFGIYSGSFDTLNFTGLGSGQSAIFNDISGMITIVPEPGTFAMILGGFGLLLGRRARRGRE